MKKILVITYGLNYGGHEQSVKRLICYIKEQNWHVEILLTEEKGDWFSTFMETVCNVTFLPYSKWGGIGHLLNIRKFIKNYRPDVLFILVDKFAQTIIPFLPNNICIVPIIRLDDEYFYNLVLTNKDFINAYVVNSPKLLKKLQSKHTDKPIHLICNGFAVLTEYELNTRVKFSDQLNLLFIGRLTEQKVPMILPSIIEICLHNRLNVRLNIIGDGELRKPLEAEISKRNLDSVIKLHGHLKNDEIIKWLLKSHILVFPTLGEGLPNVLLETQGTGCVPISSLLEDITDFVIKNNETGIIVENNTPERFAVEIEKLYNNPDDLEKLSKNGIQWISSNFSTEIEKINYVKLINELLNNQYPRDIYKFPFINANFKLLRKGDLLPEKIKKIMRPIKKALLNN